MCGCYFTVIYFLNNLKWGVMFYGRINALALLLHARRLGVCGYGYISGCPWIYPWISTENLWIWIWIWMGNFISTASLVNTQLHSFNDSA